jgi:hypothetical protein
VTYPDFEACWKNSGGAARANYGLFLRDLCDLLEIPRLIIDVPAFLSKFLPLVDCK